MHAKTLQYSRRAALVFALGVLGLVSTIGVAWLGAYLPAFVPRVRSDWFVRAPLASKSPARALLISRTRSLGAVHVAVVAAGEVPAYGRRQKGDDYASWAVDPPIYQVGETRPLESMVSPWSVMSIAPAAIDPAQWPENPGPVGPQAGVCLFTGQANGWPLVCLSCEFRYEPGTATGFQGSGGFQVPSPIAPRNWAGPFFLPYSPIWTRLLVNTALHGCAWYLLFVSPRAIRTARRWWRGGCSNCGYELSGVAADVCPECGTRIPNKVRRRGGVVAAESTPRPAMCRSPALTCYVAAAIAICFVWIISAFFFAHLRLGSSVAVGVKDGCAEVIYSYDPPAGADRFDVGLSPKVMSISWLGGSERLPELLTVSVPLWAPMVLAALMSSVMLRRLKQNPKALALASSMH